MPVTLSVPVPVARRFDLMIRADAGPMLLAVGPVFNPRNAILPLLKGRGVELGPGLNPIVRPQPGIDVRYVENWSLGLDLTILARTVRAVLRSSGAY